MDKFTSYTKALFSFFGSLGYPVYMNNQIPEGAKLPYITIQYTSSGLDESNLVSGRIWDRSTSRRKVNEISDKLDEVVGYGKRVLIGDYGSMVIYKGSPFIQPITDDDPTIQVNYFNLEVKTYI